MGSHSPTSKHGGQLEHQSWEHPPRQHSLPPLVRLWSLGGQGQRERGVVDKCGKTGQGTCAHQGQGDRRDTSTCCLRKADTSWWSRSSRGKRRSSPQCSSRRKRLQLLRRRGRQKVWK